MEDQEWIAAVKSAAYAFIWTRIVFFVVAISMTISCTGDEEHTYLPTRTSIPKGQMLSYGDGKAVLQSSGGLYHDALWRFDAPSSNVKLKQITNRYCVIQSKHYVHVIDTDSGKELLRMYLPENQFSGVAGHLLLVVFESRLIAVDIDTGKTYWEVDATGDVVVLPITDERFLMSEGEKLSLRDVKTSSELGRIETGSVDGALPATDDQILPVIIGINYFGLDLESGDKAWGYELPFLPDAFVAAKTGQLYVASGGEITAIESRTGKRRWSRQFNPLLNRMLYAKGILILETTTQEIYVMNSEDGTPIWNTVAESTLQELSGRVAHLYGSAVVLMQGHQSEYIIAAVDLQTGTHLWRRHFAAERIGEIWILPSVMMSEGFIFSMIVENPTPEYSTWGTSSVAPFLATNVLTGKQAYSTVLSPRTISAQMFDGTLFTLNTEGTITAFDFANQSEASRSLTHQTSSATPEPGTIEIRVSPHNARILIDGYVPAKGPLYKTELELGVHSVIIELDGHGSERRRIFIESGELALVDSNLQCKIEELWQYKISGRVDYAASDARRIIISSARGTAAIDGKTGQVLWQRSDKLSAVPICDGSGWYLSFAGAIESVDPNSGRTRWAVVANEAVAELHVSGDKLVAV